MKARSTATKPTKSSSRHIARHSDIQELKRLQRVLREAKMVLQQIESGGGWKLADVRKVLSSMK